VSETSRDALKTQYKDSSNLKARAALHERFGTNRRRWFQWVFDHLALADRSGPILDVGCGPGGLWQANLHRIPVGRRVLLTDLSLGMTREARECLGSKSQFEFAVADVQSLPLPSRSFDTVIANHMLYHVPDLAAALSEIHRVLRGGGRTFAATNGRRHMQELDELVLRFDPTLAGWSATREKQFVLENGADLLGSLFSDVSLTTFDDALIVPDAAPLVDYVYSMPPPRSPSAARRQEFTAFVEDRIRSSGPFRITKATGLFAAARRSA
jgi:SAM-dependent methyltransferase